MADLDFDELDKKIQDHIGNPEEQAARMEVKEALTGSSAQSVGASKSQSPRQSEGVSIAVNVNKPKVAEAPAPATPSQSIDVMPIKNTLEASTRPSTTEAIVSPTPTTPPARPDRLAVRGSSAPVRPARATTPVAGSDMDTTETARTSSQTFGSSHEMDELDLEELSSTTEQSVSSTMSQDDSLIGEGRIERNVDPAPVAQVTQGGNAQQQTPSPISPTSSSVQNKTSKGLNIWDILYYMLVTALLTVIVLLVLVLLDRYDIITAPSWLPLT